MTKYIRSQAFEVYQHRTDVFGRTELKHIDTVFYQERPEMTTREALKELIEHDGYPADILVRKGK